jgi:hypothetical protein
MAGNSKNKRKSAGVRKTLLTNTPVTIRHSEKHARILKLQPYICLETFVTRNSKVYDWNTVCTRLNVGFNLSVNHDLEEAIPVLKDGLETVLKINERFRRTGTWRADDREIAVMRQGLTLTDDIQDITTRREQLEAFKEVVVLMNRYKHTPLPNIIKVSEQSIEAKGVCHV